MIQFDLKYGGLQSVEARIKSNFKMVIFSFCTVIGKSTHARGKIFIAGHHSTTIAKCTEVFAWEEARCTDGTHHPCRTLHMITKPFGAEALGVVFHNVDLMLLCPRNQRIHVCTLAKQMNHHDRFGTRRTRALRRLWVKLKCCGIDVRKNGGGTRFDHHFCTGYE